MSNLTNEAVERAKRAQCDHAKFSKIGPDKWMCEGCNLTFTREPTKEWIRAAWAKENLERSGPTNVIAYDVPDAREARLLALVGHWYDKGNFMSVAGRQDGNRASLAFGQCYHECAAELESILRPAALRGDS